MKYIKVALIVLTTLLTTRSNARELRGFLQSVADADVIGIGVYGGPVGSPALAPVDRINNAVFWLGDPGTNSVVLTTEFLDDPFYMDSEVGIGDTVVFWGMRLGWEPFTSNTVFRGRPVSAWELREKQMQLGSTGQIPDPPCRFPGTWVNITTSSPPTVSFISNIVQSLCVSPNLNQYSETLVPPLEVGWENDLSMFKADAFMEMLKLLGREDEDFLVHVLNSPQYPGKYRGSALFQLKKRFDWPATNTVPEP